MILNTPTPTPPKNPRAVISTEYLLILAGVVIPLALLVPGILNMVATYCHRIIAVIALPFG